MSMTTAEKIAYIQSLVENDPDATDTMLGIYLKKAEAEINRRRYPFGNKPASLVGVEEDFEWVQIELAHRYFLRRGGEGEAVHIENGIHRHYGSVNDEDLLSQVPQVIRL